MKTLPEIDAAIRKRVEFHAKRGKTWSPVVPPLLHPKHIERKYTKDLRKSYTLLFEMIRNRLLINLPTLTDQNARELATRRFDTADEDLRVILHGISVEFSRNLTQNEVKRIAQRRGIEVSEYNRIQNKKVFKRLLEVDVYQSEPWLTNALESFATENAELITTLSEKHINDVRNIVVNGFRDGVAGEELASIIRNKVNRKTRANYRLIARDQVSKLNGQLTELRQRDVGVTEYKWRTSRDERVRDTHKKDGKTFSWDKPPADTGHPGADYQCRCYAEPILTGLI